MNLTNTNVYSSDRVKDYITYLDNKPESLGIRWVLDKIKALPKLNRYVEFPAYDGRHARLIENELGSDKFDLFVLYESRYRFFELHKNGKKMKCIFQSPFEKSFKKQSVDVFLSVNQLNNEIKPIEWVKELLEKIDAKHVFIVFDIVDEAVSYDLADENTQVSTFFQHGKYIDNKYNESALKQIASETGLDLEILRDTNSSSAILHKTKKLVKIEESESVEEKPKAPKKSKKKGKSKNVSKADKS